jgi:hypothetical protein
MSLPSLLRHVGAHIPRGVTVDGRVLTGHAAARAVAAGAATTVLPHVFHGGTAPVLETPTPTGKDRYARAWWEIDHDARDADIATVTAAFPSFTYDDTDGVHRFEGLINTGRGRFFVAIVGDPAGGMPHVVPVRPKALGRHEGRRGFRRADHTYTNGNLCVADRDDWDPEVHSTAAVIAWTAHWYAAYTDWLLGGPWPTGGYLPHA